MKEKEYRKLLKKVPEHDSEEFIDWIRNNNKVEWEDDSFIVIQNIKYYTKENKWLTAFCKEKLGYPSNDSMCKILWKYRDWEILKKDVNSQTIERWHIHIYRK